MLPLPNTTTSPRRIGGLARPVEPRRATLTIAVAVSLLVPAVAVGATSVPCHDRAGGAEFRPDDSDDDAASTPAQKWSPGDKRLSATEIPSGAVEIDGRVTEEAWQRAEAASDFLQREPAEGGAPSERTEVRILYDDRHLYVGFVLHDSEPDRIIATDRRRDSRMETDDTVAVLFDTFHDHQNGFLFRVNPLGTKYDALLKNERDVNDEWDEKWDAAARITARGWEAELAIPWKVLRYPTGTHVWGVDFRRELRRRNEDIYWSNYSQDFRFNDVSQAGHLVGLENLELTERFRFKPYATAGLTDRGLTDPPGTEKLTEVGVEDFKIQLHPGLVLDLTANTDFAQVEVDPARVNLTRFSLFFPEKREFFLEGKDNFGFGAGGGFGPPLALLFFSRRIGLAEDDEGDPTPIPIIAGAKLTGNVAGLSIGALNAQTDDTAVGPGNNFSVVRLQQRVLDRSRIGLLFTNRAGDDGFNRVVGADADFTLFDHLNVGGFVAGADDTDFESAAWSGQGFVEWNTDLWSAEASVLRIGPEFDTDLGFILRQDIVRQDYRIGWDPRPDVDWLRQVSLSAHFEQFADTSGTLETREQSVFANFRLESGDSFFLDVEDTFERLDAPFDIADEVVIDSGDYRFQSARVGFRSYRGRRLSARVSFHFGEFFDGTRRGIDLSPSLRLGQSVEISGSYDYNRIELPADAFSTHVVNTRVAYAIDDRWLTDAIVQYDNVSGDVTAFARLDYIYRPNDDIFVVYRQTRSVAGDLVGEIDRQLIAKMTYSFEF